MRRLARTPGTPELRPRMGIARAVAQFTIIWAAMLLLFTFGSVPTWTSLGITGVMFAAIASFAYASIGGRAGMLDRRYRRLLHRAQWRSLTPKQARALHELSIPDYSAPGWYRDGYTRSAFTLLTADANTPSDVITAITHAVITPLSDEGDLHLFNQHLKGSTKLATLVRFDPFQPLLDHPNLSAESGSQIVELLLTHAKSCACRHPQLSGALSAHPKFFNAQSQSVFLVSVAAS